MTFSAHRGKRTALHLSILGLLLLGAALVAISAEDTTGLALRAGMLLIVAGTALLLPWRFLPAIVLLAWLGANFGRAAMEESYLLFETDMLLELPGLIGVAFFAATIREALRRLDGDLARATSSVGGINPETGLFEAQQLRPALESEVARARRFNRTFALVLVGIDEMRQRFDYRDHAALSESLSATARLLRQTRNVDRVFHFGDEGFAMLLPESTENDIPGLVRRLRRAARLVRPAEGEPGGPLPVHFGATFYPSRATTVEDLLKRAEISLRLAEKSTGRYQLDGAEAPELAPPETLRRVEPEPLRHETPKEPTSLVAAAIAADIEAEDETAPQQVAVLPGGLPAVDKQHAPTPFASLAREGEDPARTAREQAPGGDLSQLLEQMDETLKIIREIRDRSAA